MTRVIDTTVREHIPEGLHGVICIPFLVESDSGVDKEQEYNDTPEILPIHWTG
ncbi:hypothetical protein M413DRAFT_448744 [Hebeloma cylindrosporum]|uniref:Uncharacterized protein n=1 Tax=Hebeloma cylindrosporum TaxID=76867 RepID=A0A0C3BY91_HEBCY|nr:hypothetical protein M413DRAFT_448744 [Hebeloma cylindrosporum h7]